MLPAVQIEMDGSGAGIISILDYLLRKKLFPFTNYRSESTHRRCLSLCCLYEIKQSFTLKICPSGYLSKIFWIET